MSDPHKASQAIRDLADHLQAEEIFIDPIKAETVNEVLALFRTLAKIVDKLDPEDVEMILNDLDLPEREIIQEKLRWL